PLGKSFQNVPYPFSTNIGLKSALEYVVLFHFLTRDMTSHIFLRMTDNITTASKGKVSQWKIEKTFFVKD
ncbi:hypothetical protein L9F63_023159, partial [Diploptera punctata]